jgi:hypothetical protein
MAVALVLAGEHTAWARSGHDDPPFAVSDYCHGGIIPQARSRGKPTANSILHQSQIGNGLGGFKRLQRIGHDAGENDDLVCGAQKSGGAQKGKCSNRT